MKCAKCDYEEQSEFEICPKCNFKNTIENKNEKVRFNKGCLVAILIPILIWVAIVIGHSIIPEYNRKKCAKEVHQSVNNIGKLHWVGVKKDSLKLVHLQKPYVLYVFGRGLEDVKKYYKYNDVFDALDSGIIVSESPKSFLNFQISEIVNSVVLIKLEEAGIEQHEFSIWEYDKLTNSSKSVETKLQDIKVYSAKTWIINSNSNEAIEWEAFNVKDSPMKKGLSSFMSAGMSGKPFGADEWDISYRVLISIENSLKNIENK